MIPKRLSRRGTTDKSQTFFRWSAMPAEHLQLEEKAIARLAYLAKVSPG